MAKDRLHKKTTTNSIDSVLSKLFRQISFNLSLQTIISNINAYLLKRHRGGNLRELSSDRGNKQKELNSETMTWKVFCRSLEIINVKKFTVTIDVTWPNNTTTVHKQTVVFSDMEREPEDGESRADSNSGEEA